jgi:hypothetical protein
MQMASSASCTWSESTSGSEVTASVLIPSSLQARDDTKRDLAAIGDEYFVEHCSLDSKRCLGRGVEGLLGFRQWSYPTQRSAGSTAIANTFASGAFASRSLELAKKSPA